MSLDFFLTAYDPSDLPGASIDPLGFERGYLVLADQILPGLTNVAARPRYFGMLCAGIHLAAVDPSVPAREAYRRRLEVLLRLERLWALANVLAVASEDESAPEVSGIRGLRYVQAYAARLRERRATQTTADFKVLLRQAQYGVLGIYAAVAEGMRMLSDRRQLSLTPDLGDRLGEAFVGETEMPRALEAAVQEGKPVSLAVLAEWGRRAHVTGRGGAEERQCLKSAFLQDHVRARMSPVLAAHPAEDGDAELRRLERIEKALRRDEERRDLHEGVRLVLAYEAAYRVAQLALERLLWLARTRPSLTQDAVLGDDVLGLARERLPGAVRKLEGALDGTTAPRIAAELTRLEDVRRFLLDAAGAARSGTGALVDVVLGRHQEVQHGKFDRGRRKMPWIERVNGRIALTSTQVGGLQYEARVPTDITPHFYRTASADALRAAAGLR